MYYIFDHETKRIMIFNNDRDVNPKRESLIYADDINYEIDVKKHYDIIKLFPEVMMIDYKDKYLRYYYGVRMWSISDRLDDILTIRISNHRIESSKNESPSYDKNYILSLNPKKDSRNLKVFIMVDEEVSTLEELFKSDKIKKIEDVSEINENIHGIIKSLTRELIQDDPYADIPITIIIDGILYNFTVKTSICIV